MLGAVVATAGWFSLAAWLHRPRDYTARWPEAARANKHNAFLRHARAVGAGPFAVITPASGTNVLALICPKDEPNFPFILLLDDSKNGVVDSITIADRQSRSVSLYDRTEDGIWNQLMYSTGSTSNPITVVDRNMDGTFDVRLGPDGRKSINPESKWYDLIAKDGEAYIRIHGGEKRLESKDGAGWIAQALQEYQKDRIRRREAPLPVRLTEETDRELVEEGVLPPRKDRENFQQEN